MVMIPIFSIFLNVLLSGLVQLIRFGSIVELYIG
jgi:hypothetical protein